MNPERSWSFDKVTGIYGTIYVDFHIKEKGREKNQSYYYYAFIEKFFFDRRKNRMDRFSFSHGNSWRKEKKKGRLFVESGILSWSDQSLNGNGGGKKFSRSSRGNCIDAADIDIKSHYSYSISGDATVCT